MNSRIVELHQPCPKCPSTDAYCLYEDGHGYCYSCSAYFKPNGEFVSDGFTYEYLGIRGLSKETLRLYNIQTKINGGGEPVSVGFVYPGGACKVRLLTAKQFNFVGESKPELFGLDKFALGAHKSIIITEGEFDAASMWQVCKVPSVSTRSSSSAVSDCSAVRQQLNSYERIYLAFDGDAAGRDATASVARLFDPNKVFVVKFTNRKDANEYLQAGEGDDLLNLFHNARLYQPANIVTSIGEFKELLTGKPKVGVPYPFPTLTKMTYGIRTGECVLIKAPEKVGKTALMHQIEYQLLKETQENVAAIYIEESKQRHLQALAGIELKKPVHLPDCDCTQDQILDAIERVVGKDERLFLYSHYGSNDPDTIADTIRFLVSARACRYVLFDHISMACTGIAGERDERRALEYLATKLEMMVKELDFALLMVSHVNDIGQTRGSHYLTKLADIVIDLSRDMVNPSEAERCKTNLSIPYNRFCSNTGSAGILLFDPKTYILREAANDNTRSGDNRYPLSEGDGQLHNSRSDPNWPRVAA